MPKGVLLVVTGPSGVGKGTLLNKVRSGGHTLYMSVSATTRAPRPGEEDGVNYYFVTRERFAEMVRTNQLLEHATYVENCYGTPRGPVEQMLESGKDVVLEIDLQGARQVRKSYPEAVLVFIAPPSVDTLEQRLRGRSTETEAVIQKRLTAARTECEAANEFDYIVVNGELELAAEELTAIIRAAHCRPGYVNF